MNEDKVLKSAALAVLMASALPHAAAKAESVEGLYYHIGGGAENVALTTLRSKASGDPIIVAAIINAEGAVEVIAYEDTDKSASGIKRLGYASDDNGGMGFAPSAVSITALDSTKVATAVVDNLGLTFVQTWSVGSAGVVETNSAFTQNPVLGSSGVNFESLAIVSPSPTEVVTAATATYDGDLVVLDWHYVPGAGFVNPVNVGVGLAGDVPFGFGNLAMVVTTPSQVAVAECDGAFQLKLIAWKVGPSVSYTPKRQGSSRVSDGCPVAASVSGALDLSGTFVSTASVNADGALQVANSLVTSTSASPTFLAGWLGNVSQPAICGQCSVGGDTLEPLTAGVGRNGHLRLGNLTLNVDTHIAVTNDEQDVAITPEGADSAGNFHFATAVVNGAGNIQINTWKLKP
jgi:hypothetical protein